MRRAGSLRRRLGLATGGLLAALWLVAAVGSALVIRHELDEAFDSALWELAERMATLVGPGVLADPDGLASDYHAGDVGRDEAVALVNAHEKYLTYMVRDAAGQVLLASRDVEPGSFPPRPMVGFHHTRAHKLYGVSMGGGAIFVEAAEPLAHRREATLEAVGLLLAPLALLVPLSFLLIWSLLLYALRPVTALRDTIEARSASDLSPVNTDPVPDEIRPAVIALNRLLDRLRRALEAERSFTANSAHEFRTPIAGALAQTQRLMAESPDVAQRAREIERPLKRLARLSEKLMNLAKAEGGALLAEKARDLRPVLRLLVDDFARHAGTERLVLRLSADAALRTHLDPDAFGILMRNLIENALAHGAPDRPVEISVPAAGVIRVTNAGPVVPRASLGTLTQRFERAGATGPGAGLGLSIADIVLRGAGGALALASPAPGRADGFEATVHLPQ